MNYKSFWHAVGIVAAFNIDYEGNYEANMAFCRKYPTHNLVVFNSYGLPEPLSATVMVDRREACSN